MLHRSFCTYSTYLEHALEINMPDRTGTWNWVENIRREMKSGEERNGGNEESAVNWSAGETVFDVCTRLNPQLNRPVVLRLHLLLCPVATCPMPHVACTMHRNPRHLIATTTFGPKSSLWLGAGADPGAGAGAGPGAGFRFVEVEFQTEAEAKTEADSETKTETETVVRRKRANGFSTGRAKWFGSGSGSSCATWSGHPAIFQHFRNKIFNNSPRRPLSASTFKFPAVESRTDSRTVHQHENVVEFSLAEWKLSASSSSKICKRLALWP